MEYAKDEIFQIRYNTNLNRLQIGKERWTSRLLKTIKRHKFISLVSLAFVMFSIMNLVMINSFMNVLQNL